MTAETETIAAVLNAHPDQLFVDGQWIQGQGGRLQVVNPATEEVIGSALDAAPVEVERAVAVARRAFERGDWSGLALADRVAILRRVLAMIDNQQELLAQLQTAQMGVPIRVSRAMIRAGTGLFRAYIEGAEGIEYEYIRQDLGAQALVRRVPVGVVGAITPWNGPLATVLNKVLPALLTGCTVVLKPAPETPAEAGLFADFCAAAGVPAGVLNVVTGSAAAGEALVSSPGVDKITFTGSTATGRRVGQLCGPRFTRMSLELGGKSAGLVLPDADLDAAIPEIVSGNFFNSGQACIAITRVLVPRARRQEIVEALVEASRRLIVGDPLDEATELGPLVARRQRDRVESYVASGLEEGAQLATGGRRPPGQKRGWYFEPTIFTGVENGMRIARDEIFGPVLSVIQYESEQHALEIANDCDYGLHGAVFTSDPERGLQLASAFQCGSVAVNAYGLTPSTPYGGMKGSGVGREHGREGVASFLEYRSFVIPSELSASLQRRGVPVA